MSSSYLSATICKLLQTLCHFVSVQRLTNCLPCPFLTPYPLHFLPLFAAFAVWTAWRHLEGTLINLPVSNSHSSPGSQAKRNRKPKLGPTDNVCHVNYNDAVVMCRRGRKSSDFALLLLLFRCLLPPAYSSGQLLLLFLFVSTPASSLLTALATLPVPAPYSISMCPLF